MTAPSPSASRAARFPSIIVPAAGLLLLAAAPALAQWSDDPSQNLVVADRPAGQTQPKLLPTSDGGFYVSWFGGIADGFDVYLQRLDAHGLAQWQENGIRVADRSYTSTEDYGLAVDAGGDALLAFRFPDAQARNQVAVIRVAPDGELVWDAPGVFASDDPSGVHSPRVAAGPDGSVFVAWTAASSGHIAVQRLDATGQKMWGNGVTVPVPTGVFFLADLHADGQGNVIVSGSAQLSFPDRRLWAQKLAGSDGSPMWGPDPVQVFNGTDGALQLGYFPPFTPEPDGGAVFAWYQVAGVGEARVRVQRVNSDGTLAFPQNGVNAATGTDRERLAPSASVDHATGDIYVVWPEEQQPAGQPRTFGVAAQRIDIAGSRMWGDAARTIVPFGDHQAGQVRAVAVGEGAIFAWALGSSPTPMRIDAARLDAAGEFVWDDDVEALKLPAGTNARMQGARSTTGFAAYAWADAPGPGGHEVIKAQNIHLNGALGPLQPPQAVVDPTELSLTVAPGETATAELTLANTGGSVLTFSATVGGTGSAVVDFEDGQNPYDFTFGIPQADHIVDTGGNPGRWFRNSALQTFAPSLYIPSVDGSPFVGNFVERRVDLLGVDAQTVSVGLGAQERPFSLVLVNHNGEPNNVEAHHYVYFPGPTVPQPGEGWKEFAFPIPYDFGGSMPEGWAGGYYGDPENLPPGVTWKDVAASVDEVRFQWGHPAFFYLLQNFDIGVDNVRVEYAGGDGPVSVTPQEGSVEAGGTQFLEVGVDAAELELGVHHFEIRFETNDPDSPLLIVSLEVHVSTTSAEDGAVPRALALRQTFPNPVGSFATVEFDLPTDGPVRLDVFDLTGRLVSPLLHAEMAAGTHRVEWDTRGLAAGTYILRLAGYDAVRSLRATVVR